MRTDILTTVNTMKTDWRLLSGKISHQSHAIIFSLVSANSISVCIGNLLQKWDLHYNNVFTWHTTPNRSKSSEYIERDIHL